AMDWAARYLAELATQRQLSPHTVDAYRRDLAELAALAGHADWPRRTPCAIRRDAAKLQAGGQSARTIARKLAGWRGFYAWLSNHT
ncbi:site-specific integrase, partial [Listeria monocytogenes]|nr:site-specific integrase [Listeria monocytogenes]